MFSNLGFHNTATGFQALFNNNVGNDNTANGANALLMNNDGSQNTATGNNALRSNTVGNNNVAEGVFTLSRNTSGSSNIALGFNAGSNLTTGSNNIDIGNPGVAGESNKIRIGTATIQDGTFIAGIHSGVVINGVQVVVNPNGKLGTIVSSARYKEAIKPMDKASEAILSLEPVTFRYKHELDPDGIPQFGLVAEQVEKVNPDLIARDADGRINTVRYEAVNAMLLNEFLKEHRQVQQLKATVAQQQEEFRAKIAQQQKQIEALTAGLQKVAAHVEPGNSAPRLVNSN
jgi:hypothetical protein